MHCAAAHGGRHIPRPQRPHRSGDDRGSGPCARGGGETCDLPDRNGAQRLHGCAPRALHLGARILGCMVGIRLGHRCVPCPPDRFGEACGSGAGAPSGRESAGTGAAIVDSRRDNDYRPHFRLHPHAPAAHHGRPGYPPAAPFSGRSLVGVGNRRRGARDAGAPFSRQNEVSRHNTPGGHRGARIGQRQCRRRSALPVRQRIHHQRGKQHFRP